jgi:hypothetical protein
MNANRAFPLKRLLLLVAGAAVASLVVVAPVKLKHPVKNASLNIKNVTATHVSGLFGKAPWSVTRRPGAPSKRPAVGANAA